MSTHEEHRKALIARKEELQSRLVTIEDELDDPLPKDFEDQAVELEDDEVLTTLGEAGVLELRQIDAALDRIEQGTYGECLNCGNEISAERLEAVPHAALCRDCAK